MAPVGPFLKKGRAKGAVSSNFMAFMKDNQVIAEDFTMTQNYIIKDISAQASDSNFDQYQQALRPKTQQQQQQKLKKIINKKT